MREMGRDMSSPYNTTCRMQAVDSSPQHESTHRSIRMRGAHRPLDRAVNCRVRLKVRPERSQQVGRQRERKRPRSAVYQRKARLRASCSIEAVDLRRKLSKDRIGHQPRDRGKAEAVRRAPDDVRRIEPVEEVEQKRARCAAVLQLELRFGQRAAGQC